jgi:glycerophosphoryl diester phosphodiesterase
MAIPLVDVDPTRSVRLVAHRGAGREERENTLAAIDAAARLGADGVEVDLRVAGDGGIVVVHDPDLTRTHGLDLRVSDVDTTTLRRHGMPTLEEVMALCEDLGLWVDLEVKEEDERIAHALSLTTFAHGGIVSSFLPSVLDMVGREAPQLDRALLTMPGVDPELAIEAARPHAGWNPFFLTLTENPGCIEAARQSGLGVHVWTVDDPQLVRDLAALGVDSIITNVPDVALWALA